MTTEPTTPARSAFSRSPDGLIRIGHTSLTYSDESEDRVLALVQSSDDLRSTSTEMLDRATDWAERYHTHPARANIIRAFDVPAGATILEVGAGCGGVTRYLGETGGLVDALEPMEHRARVARERTRDQPGVEVLVGEIADLPPEAAYDVVVVVGVLEYVGLGTRDRAPYVEFLSQIRARLKPTGSLILAIENQLGVKYIVGAPEDHTSQVFDGIEGYPHGEGARTFSRAQLLSLFEEAGLTGRTLCAFPDYKLTRTVLDPEALPEPAKSLLTHVPDFPSPDWTLARPRLASERLVWSEFVDAGLAGEVPNSFIAVAGKTGPSALWPEGRAGVFFAVDAQPAFASSSTIECGSEVVVSRDMLDHSQRADLPHGIEFSATESSFEPGATVAEALGAASEAERAALLSQWRAAVESTSGPEGCAIDPTVIVRADGTMATLPVALRTVLIDKDDAVVQGLLRLGLRVAATTPPRNWPGASHVRDVVAHLGSLLGLGDDWIEKALAIECLLLPMLSSRFPPETASQDWNMSLSEQLNTPLDALELGTRDWQLARELAPLLDRYQQSQDLLAEAQREVERLRALVPRRKR